jgi:hypothetical protein
VHNESQIQIHGVLAKLLPRVPKFCHLLMRLREMAIKDGQTQAMKKDAYEATRGEFLVIPASPITGHHLFLRLRRALAEAFGKEQTFSDLARLTGHPRTTVQHWFQTYTHPHLLFLLSLFEQLPQRRRAELIAEFCRELPLLDHPRLTHDPLAVGVLENIIQDKKGVSLIRGGSEYQRTFVVTALGHSAIRSNKEISIAGLDIHEPKRFVPVHGVTYFRQPLSLSKLQSAAATAWNGISTSNAQLMIFNGVWSTLPELRTSIALMGEDRHVIIADDVVGVPAEFLGNLQAKVNVITLSQAKENPAWIRVSISVL